MRAQEGHSIEPPFCLVHGQCAPCLACLQPEVAIMIDRQNCFDGCNVFFTAPNLDQN